MEGKQGNLLIIVPSRGRPGNIARLLDAVHRLRQAGAHTCTGIDDDDPEAEQYRKAFRDHGSLGDILEEGPRKGLAGWTNEIAMKYAGQYRYLASFGDDHLPRTRGFDRALTRGIEDMGGTGFTYPWDGRREDIPEAVVMSSDIVKALGWMCEPSLRHWYVDNVWDDLGRQAGCIRHLRAVAVDHLHPAVARAQPDETYASSSGSFSDDKKAYGEWRQTRMAADVETICALRDRRAQPSEKG